MTPPTFTTDGDNEITVPVDKVVFVMSSAITNGLTRIVFGPHFSVLVKADRQTVVEKLWPNPDAHRAQEPGHRPGMI